MHDEQHFVGLVIGRRQSDARIAVGKEFAADDRARTQERLKCSAADNSGWWLRLSEIAETHGRAFVVDAAAAVAEISTSPEAYMALRDACHGFFDFLGAEYEWRYRGNRHFYSPKDAAAAPLPQHWQKARDGLELDLEIQRRHFTPQQTFEPAQSLASSACGDGGSGDQRHRPDDQKLAALAQALDEAGISIREVKKEHIKERWNVADGSCPKVEAVTVLMKGAGKGGRPRGR